jgi:hypothetical protein
MMTYVTVDARVLLFVSVYTFFMTVWETSRDVSWLGVSMPKKFDVVVRFLEVISLGGILCACAYNAGILVMLLVFPNAIVARGAREPWYV